MEENPTATGASSQSTSRPVSTATINGAIQTDSMVTIRLSDPPNASPSLSNTQIHDHSVKSVEKHAETVLEDSPIDMATDADNNDFAAYIEQGSRNEEVGSGLSHNSSGREEQSICTSTTIRSRSNTSGSISSSGSAQVDWEELEKSEEQAPRDDGSDEVSYHLSSLHFACTFAYACKVDGFPPRQA